MMTIAQINDMMLQLHECGREVSTRHTIECKVNCTHPLVPAMQCSHHDIDRRAIVREIRVLRSALIEAAGDEAPGFIERAEGRER